jgi:phage baseplate assembly protein W
MAKTRNYKSIAVKLPLAYDDYFGPYGMLTKPEKAIKQNFKNLILTNPGERVMNSNFGVGLSRFLFENKTTDVVEDINEAIYTQTAKYLPFIQILDVSVKFVDNTLLTRIKYFVPDFGIADALDLKIFDQNIGTTGT